MDWVSLRHVWRKWPLCGVETEWRRDDMAKGCLFMGMHSALKKSSPNKVGSNNILTVSSRFYNRPSLWCYFCYIIEITILTIWKARWNPLFKILNSCYIYFLSYFNRICIPYSSAFNNHKTEQAHGFKEIFFEYSIIYLWRCYNCICGYFF